MVVFWMTRLLFLMDWMEVRNVATRPAGAAAIPNKSFSHIIFRFAHPNQAAMYLPNGQAIVSQIFRDKATYNATYVDMEKLTRAMSFFLELAEWGPEGPPGGFSVGRFRRIRRVSSHGRHNYKTVYGRLYFIPKPGTEAERMFLKRAVKMIEKVKDKMGSQTTENLIT